MEMTPDKTLNGEKPKEGSRHLEIPTRYRSLVYLVGNLGFPVLVAIYVLVIMRSDLEQSKEVVRLLNDSVGQLDASVDQLATRIEDKPMGIDKSADFIDYICFSLNNELKAGLPAHFKSLDLTCETATLDEITRTLTLVDREILGYLRPIIRTHRRFASRFPTVGGNLGTQFITKSPAVDIDAGESEAALVAITHTDVAEALSAVIINNVHDYGHPVLGVLRRIGAAEQAAKTEDELSMLASAREDALQQVEGQLLLIEPDLFLRLALDGVDTVTTIMRDQMLQNTQLNSAGTH